MRYLCVVAMDCGVWCVWCVLPTCVEQPTPKPHPSPTPNPHPSPKPSSWDWTTQGAVTPVKNQIKCGAVSWVLEVHANDVWMWMDWVG
jgi:hypothetical protein